MAQFSGARAVGKRYQTSQSTIWRWANEPRFAHLNFPKPVKLGPNTTRWDDSDLDRYDAERKAAERYDSVVEECEAAEDDAVAGA